MILAGDLAAGGKLNEAARRRAARRLARAGARSVSRARGVRPRAAGEESRRVRAAGSPSRRPTRSTSCARCSTNSSGGGSRRAQRAEQRRELARTRRTDGKGCGRRATSMPILPPTSNSTIGWSSSPATRSCCRTIAASSTNSTSSAARRSRKAASCRSRPASTRDRRADRRRGDAAAGRALYEHVMASRERMHARRSVAARPTAGASRPASRKPR